MTEISLSETWAEIFMYFCLTFDPYSTTLKASEIKLECCSVLSFDHISTSIFIVRYLIYFMLDATHSFVLQLDDLVGDKSAIIDWRRSFYLNLIAHTTFSVTVAICR